MQMLKLRCTKVSQVLLALKDAEKVEPAFGTIASDIVTYEAAKQDAAVNPNQSQSVEVCGCMQICACAWMCVGVCVSACVCVCVFTSVFVCLLFHVAVSLLCK